MQHILVVADASWVRNEVHAALTTPDFDLTDLDDPVEAAATAASKGVDAVVVDLQVGSMGGMAVVRDVRDRCNADGKHHLPVIMLLDRAADGFLAKRAGAAAWLVKPFTAHDIRAAVASAFPKEPAPAAAPADMG